MQQCRLPTPVLRNLTPIGPPICTGKDSHRRPFLHRNSMGWAIPLKGGPYYDSGPCRAPIIAQFGCICNFASGKGGGRLGRGGDSQTTTTRDEAGQTLLRSRPRAGTQDGCGQYLGSATHISKSRFGPVVGGGFEWNRGTAFPRKRSEQGRGGFWQGTKRDPSKPHRKTNL